MKCNTGLNWINIKFPKTWSEAQTPSLKVGTHYVTAFQVMRILVLNRSALDFIKTMKALVKSLDVP